MNVENPISHRFRRVSDIKIARQNIVERKRKQHILEIQEAVRGMTSSSEPDSGVGEQTQNRFDIIKIRSELFKALSESMKGVPYTHSLFSDDGDLQAKAINEKVGPLLYEDVPLGGLMIPKTKSLRGLENNPDFEPESIRALLHPGRRHFKNNYNDWLIQLRSVAPTIGDLQRLPNQDLKVGFGRIAVNAYVVSLFKSAFKPQPISNTN